MENELTTLIKDYDNYMRENSYFYNKYRDKESLIYDRIEVIFHIINYLKEKQKKAIPVTNDEILLFKLVTEYLYEYKISIDSINKKIDYDIDERSAVILLMLDFDDYLSDYDAVSYEDKELYKELEEVVYQKKEFSDELYLRIEGTLKKENYLSMLDLFAKYVDLENII